MELGPNMRRLVDSDASESLATCVVAGPGDLLVWEVRITVETDGIPLEVTGRGTDLESAAAAVMPLVTAHSPSILGQAEISRSE